MKMIHPDNLERARRLHGKCPVIDTHVDTTQRLADSEWDISRRHEDGHTDIPRMRDGGISAMFFAVYAPGPVEPGAGIAAAREQIERIDAVIRRNPHDLAAARTADDIRQAHADGRIAIPIAIEGGYLIEDSIETLREFRSLGATYLTLTHSFHTSWADSAGVHMTLEPLHGGLTDFGREVIRELNRLGMMVDVSHVSDDTLRDAVETSAAPIIATHSSCRAVSPHRRNLPDELIRLIADTGGVVQINFAASFIDPASPPLDNEAVQRWIADGATGRHPLCDHVTPLSVLVDHFDHALQLVGPDHVGIGTDFDGVPVLPEDMEDCSKLPNLTAALLQRGYNESDLAKVLGGNVLRVMAACEAIGSSHAPSHSE